MAAQKSAGKSSKSSTVSARVEKKVSRPGVHAKTKTSSNKTSKNYKKPYAGQGH
jgi:hypothetical protein